MTVTTETRERYIVLAAERAKAYDSVAPFRKAYQDAMEPVDAIDEQIEELLEDGDVEPCMGCGVPVFDTDTYAVTDDLERLCEKCAPTYDDMMRTPEMFRGDDDEPMTAAEAKAICDAHVKAGGSMDDKIVVGSRAGGADDNLPHAERWQFFGLLPSSSGMKQKYMAGYEGQKWVCYFWNSGFSHFSFGLHLDWHNPNIEIHLPFGFFRIGVRSEWRRLYPIVDSIVARWRT